MLRRIQNPIEVHIPSFDASLAIHFKRAPLRKSPQTAQSVQSNLLELAAAEVDEIFVAFTLGSVLSANTSTLVGEIPVVVGSGGFVTRKPCSL